jgi:hypothetical protein
MPPRERELVDDRVEIPSPSGSSGEVRHPGLRSKNIGAKAIGALAVGAVAIGAFAIGALAIGRLVVGRARIRRIEIDDLVVRRLHITEKPQGPNKSEAER